MSGSGIGIALLPVVVDRMNRYGGLGTLFLILAPVMGLMIGMAILFPTASEIVERSSLIDQSDQEESNEPKLVKYTKSISLPVHSKPTIDLQGPPSRQASTCDHVLPFKQRLCLRTEKCDDAKFQNGAMDLIREPKIYISLACYSLQVIPAYVPSFYLPAFANDSIGRPLFINYMMIAMGFSNMLSRVMSGYLVTKFSCITPAQLLVFAIALAAFTMFLLPMCTNGTYLVVLPSLFAASFGFSRASLMVPFLTSLFPITQLNTVFSWHSFFMGIALLGGEPLVGFIHDMHEFNYQVTFTFGCFISSAFGTPYPAEEFQANCTELMKFFSANYVRWLEVQVVSKYKYRFTKLLIGVHPPNLFFFTRKHMDSWSFTGLKYGTAEIKSYKCDFIVCTYVGNDQDKYGTIT